MQNSAWTAVMRSISVILLLTVLPHCNFIACDREMLISKLGNGMDDYANGMDPQDPMVSRCFLPVVVCFLKHYVPWVRYALPQGDIVSRGSPFYSTYLIGKISNT